MVYCQHVVEQLNSQHLTSTPTRPILKEKKAKLGREKWIAKICKVQWTSISLARDIQQHSKYPIGPMTAAMIASKQ